MKYLIILILLYVGACWSIPKPMESVTNYNVMMVHGAYGSDKGIQNCSDSLPVEAALETGYLSTSKDAANIQNSDYYYGDVDKVITLDSPHEGIAALSCLPVILEAERRGSIIFIPYICAGIAFLVILNPLLCHAEQREGSSQI